MNQTKDEQINEILSSHAQWFWTAGSQGKPANFYNFFLKDYKFDHENLRHANFQGANLRKSSFVRALLAYTNFSFADLNNADFTGADLRHANFSNAILTGANFTNADLSNVTGNGREIKTLVLPLWGVNLYKDILQIGCQKHTVEEWKNFTDGQIASMDFQALNWWKVWKTTIFKFISTSAKSDKIFPS